MCVGGWMNLSHWPNAGFNLPAFALSAVGMRMLLLSQEKQREERKQKRLAESAD